MRAPGKVPEACACKGVDCPSCCALYHQLISEGNICELCIHKARVGAVEEQAVEGEKSKAPLTFAAAMFFHLCAF